MSDAEKIDNSAAGAAPFGQGQAAPTAFTAAEQNTISKYTAEGCIKAYETAMRFHAQRKGGAASIFPNFSFVALVGRKLSIAAA